MSAPPEENVLTKEDLINYKLSPAELKALDECNRESLVRRSLPIATLCSGGVWYAVNAGFLKGSPRFGAVPNMLVAGFVGFFIGKISYRNKCFEKFMNIPDSKIGQALRQSLGKSKTALGDFDPGWGSGFGSFPNTSPNAPGSSDRRDNVFNDITPRTYADLDIDRPLTNFDDSFSANNYSKDLNPEDSLSAAPPSQLYSYDELRKKNREEYEQSRVKPYPRRTQPPPAASGQPPSPAPAESPRIWDRDPPPTSSPSPPQSWSKQRNAYGDVWEK